MNLAALVMLALTLAVALHVFSLGLKTDVRDLGYLLRRPGKLARSLFAMLLVMPFVAALIDLLFPLHLPVEIMLVAVALAPVPPLLPHKQSKAGGQPAYSVSLLVIAALAAIVAIPALLEVMERVFSVSLRMTPWAVAQVMLKTVLLPLAIGMSVRALWPKFAARMSGPALAFAAAVIPVAALAIIVAAWPVIAAQAGDGTLAALAAFVGVGIMVGHVLGGPDPSDRTVLALSTASRHPGAAAAIASVNFPQERAAIAVLLLYLIIAGVASALYLRWRKAREPGALPQARAH
jgi:bile acid:Na+ symporter, BASS family